MKKRILKILALLLILVLLIGGAFLLYRYWKERSQPQSLFPEGFEISLPAITSAESEGKMYDDEPLPDFTVYDADGNPVQLSDFLGTPVVLNFWASWVEPCTSELADFNAVFQEYGDSVTFLMVNVTDGTGETMETAQEFIAQQGFSFPVYFDTEMDASLAYGVSTLPSTYFIDTEGMGQAYAVGPIPRETMEVGISYILGES